MVVVVKFGGGGIGGGGAAATPRAPTVSPSPTVYTDYEYLLGLFCTNIRYGQFTRYNYITIQGNESVTLYEDPATYDIRTADAQAIT